MTISLQTTKDDGMSLQPPLLTPSTEVASEQSQKHHIALGETSPGEDVIYNSILAGNEASLRRSAALKEDVRNLSIRESLIRDFSNRRGGGPLSELETDFVSSLSAEQLANPNTILESKYAERVLNEIYADSSVLQDSLKEEPAATNVLLDVAEQTVAKREVVQRELSKVQSAWDDSGWFSPTESSWLGAVGTIAETIFPFKSALNETGTIFGSGQSLTEYIENLYRLPTDEFERTFVEDFQEVSRRNTLDGMHFAEAVLGYSTLGRYLDNSLNVADILGALTGTIATTAAKGVTKTLKGSKTVTRNTPSVKQETSASNLSDLAEGLKSTVKSLRTRGVEVEEVLSASGEVQGASIMSALKTAKAKFFSKDPNQLSKSLLREIPTFMNPARFFEGGFLAREMQQRLQEQAELTNAHLLEALTDKQGINTLSDSALEKAFELARENLRDEFTHLNNGILDIINHNPEDILSENAFVTLRLGRLDGDVFENRHQANYWLKNEYKIPGGTVRPFGKGYVIDVTRPIDETDISIKPLLVTTENATPQSIANQWVGGIRSADDLLGKEQREMRKTFAHGPQNLAMMLEHVVSPVAALRGTSKANFRSFTEAMRDYTYKGPNGEKLRGREFNTLGEFEEAWQESFKHLPSAEETAAYMSYKALNEFDYLLRNISIYRFKARQGRKLFNIEKNLWFEGIAKDNIPWDGENAGILFKGEVHEMKPRDLTKRKELKTAIDAGIADGSLKVIQLAEPLSRPFGDIGMVNFVVTEAYSSKNIPFKQIPYRPGGHVVYDYPFYIKQGSISTGKGGRQFHEGDLTVLPATTEVEARNLVKSLEEARKLFNADDKDSFDLFVSRNLPWSPGELAKKFSSGVLKKDTPFVVTGRGSSTLATNEYENLTKRGLVSWNQSEYNLDKNINKEFAGRRNWDVHAASRTADEDNPVFELTKPRLMDTLSTMNRATGRMIRSQFLEPYKIRSAESFVEEFASVLKGSDEALRRDPIGVLFDPPWKENVAGVDKDLLSAAKLYRKSVLSLLGTRTPFQQNWGRVQERLMNTVYERGGQKANDWVYEHMMTGNDPSRFMRQIAFHSKLGLFNPVQLVLQAQTYIHTVALSPIEAPKSLSATYFMRALEAKADNALDEKFLGHFAKKASNFGWKEDDFVEAYKFMRRSGIFTVAGEHSWRVDMLDPKIVKNRAGNMLEKGSFFFREGERFNRLAAFNTAYLEWRKANPVAKFDRAAQNSVMARQDILSVNMTKASNASWQHGFASVPTQFFSYQQRLFEQFWSKRIGETPMERALVRARMLGVYSAMYGIPVTGGAATMMPFYDDVRTYLLENGIAHDSIVMEAFMEGIPSMIFNAAVGTDLNFNERYGPGGLDIIKEALAGDVGILEVLMGASGSILGDIYNSTIPFVMDLGLIMKDGTDALPIAVEDFIDLSREISTLNNGVKMVYALSTGQMISKGEVFLDDATTMEAVFSGILGLEPKEIGDARRMSQSRKTVLEAQSYARQQFAKTYKRMLKSPVDQREPYAKKMKMWRKWGNIDNAQASRIVSEVHRTGWMPFVDLEQRLFVTQSPAEQKKSRLEDHKRRIEEE